MNTKLATCAFCQTEFQQGKTPALCCSVACSNRHRRLRPLSRSCEWCSVTFSPEKNRSRFCSVRCSALARVPGTPEERFWSKVHKTDDCWNWTAGTNRDGYGQLRFRGKSERAHRVAWLLHHGSFPSDGMHVLHACDNVKCVRIDHLFLGTHTDNMLDMAKKGRAHYRKLTEDQVREIRRRIAAGERQRIVAVDFGITRESARDIANRTKWGWLE